MDDEEAVPPAAEDVLLVTRVSPEDVVFVDAEEREVFERLLDPSSDRFFAGAVFDFGDEVFVR